MRVIDFDVHLAVRKDSLAVTIEELIPLLDKAGIDKAVTWPMVSYNRQVSEDNRAIWEAVRRFPDRIIPFGGINPMLGVDNAMAEMDRCINEFGFRGFKLNGARDGYYIDDPELAMPFFRKIADNKLVLALHCGINDPIHTHPWLVGKVAKAFPNMPIVMVHMGGAGSPGLHDAAIKIAQECPNIYPAPSEADPKAIIRAIRELGPERVLFASDIPFSLGRVSRAIFEVVLEEGGFGARTKELVMGGNAARILGL